jgi:hypothetical protein
VRAYLESIDLALPYHQAGITTKDTPKVLPRPDILVWLDRVERWGLPLPGTWLQQPKNFMIDLEVAQKEKQIYRNTPKKQVAAPVSRGSDPFAGAPSFDKIKAM